MAHFFFKLTPPRTTFAADMTEEEESLMEQHAAYWREMIDSGEAIVFGPVLDPAGPFGIAIAHAEDDEAARAIAAADPAIARRLGFAYDIHPMRAMTGAYGRPH